jgi:hypothetical protein
MEARQMLKAVLVKGAAVAIVGALALGSGSDALAADGHSRHGHKHPANHGAAVSAVARSDATTGEAHGDAVSAVARSNAGGTPPTSASTSGNAVSTLATTTAMTGEAKGDAISALARNGHGKAK